MVQGNLISGENGVGGDSSNADDGFDSCALQVLVFGGGDLFSFFPLGRMFQRVISREFFQDTKKRQGSFTVSRFAGTWSRLPCHLYSQVK